MQASLFLLPCLPDQVRRYNHSEASTYLFLSQLVFIFLVFSLTVNAIAQKRGSQQTDYTRYVVLPLGWLSVYLIWSLLASCSFRWTHTSLYVYDPPTKQYRPINCEKKKKNESNARSVFWSSLPRFLSISSKLIFLAWCYYIVLLRCIVRSNHWTKAREKLARVYSSSISTVGILDPGKEVTTMYVYLGKRKVSCVLWCRVVLDSYRPPVVTWIFLYTRVCLISDVFFCYLWNVLEHWRKWQDHPSMYT